MIRECGTCQAYIFPPEDSHMRADIGRCSDDNGAVTYESSVCGDWRQREEE